MADQVDVQLQVEDENPTEEDVESAAKKHRVVDDLSWSKIDNELRVEHKKKVENSQKPTMWEYNPKGGVPTEFANLDPSTFLTSRQGRILCFLPMDILIRICSMLSVLDFVHLSMTCRFLHWRMFTFCTCYAPYSAEMRIEDWRIDEDFWESADAKPLTLIYFLNNDEKNHDGFNAEEVQLYSLEHEGRRSVYICQPFCLRKPFFFDTLKLYLTLPFYRQKYYDMCLPYIMNVRGLARNLNLSISTITANKYSSNISKFLVNYSDTNDFFATINVDYYDRYTVVLGPNDIFFSECARNNKDIYINCPYARKMNIVYIGKGQEQYWLLLDPHSAIIATLKNFLTGSKDLVFHKYYGIEENNGRLLLFEYLFHEFGQFAEFFYARTEDHRNFHHCHHVWKKVIATEHGGQLRIEIKKPADRFHRNSGTSMAIGKEEMFDEMVNKYIQQASRENIRWNMETALEPDDFEESDKAVESEDVEDLGEVEQPEESEKSDEVEGSEEAEEEQEASSICGCLKDNSCAIQ